MGNTTSNGCATRQSQSPSVDQQAGTLQDEERKDSHNEQMQDQKELELETAKQDFEYNNNQIKSVIQKTGQNELNVGKFLRLVHDLIDATTETVSHSNKLEAQISIFDELIGREYQYELTIEQYFNEHNLSRLVPMLAAESFVYMKDIICDNQEEYEDDIYNLFMERDVILTKREYRLLKKNCLNPDIWKKHQQEQENAVKDGLDIICPLLGEFFVRINEGIEKSQRLLSYEPELNDMQREAINKVDKLPAAIEYVVDHEDIRKDWEINSKCQAYSKSHKKWFDGIIVDITHDNEGEWLHVKYSINERLCAIQQIERSSQEIRALNDDSIADRFAVEYCALTASSLIHINVTESMFEKFNQNVTATRAFTLAKCIEQCCMQIIKAQSKIRHSLLLTKEILKLKPGYMNVEALELWEAINEVCVYIFNAALNMVRVSAEFFAYFARFKQSFDCYQSYKEKSLLIALEHLRMDIRYFADFKTNFTQITNKLSTEAMNCVANLVNCMSPDSETFEKFRNSRESSLKSLLDKRLLQLGEDLDQKEQTVIELNGKEPKDKENRVQNIVDSDDEETDRFFVLLNDMKEFDDEKLSTIASTFSMNTFEKYANCLNWLNQSSQRLSSVVFQALPEIKFEIILSTISSDDGYYSSKSDISQIFQKDSVSSRNRLLISGFIRNTIHDTYTATFVIMIAVDIIDEILLRYKKSRRKKKRKKKTKNTNKLLSPHVYEFNINVTPNTEHTQQIKEWILTRKWYNKSNVKNANLYGATHANGRITLSLELSEFMRRCQQIVAKVQNESKDINLIPVTMKDCADTLDIQYLWIIEIDAANHVHIGISFKCAQSCNTSGMDIIFTGFHLNPKLLCPQYDSGGLCIGYLDIYSQTKEHFEYRYNKFKSFVGDFLSSEIDETNFMDWKEKAQTLWNEVMGTHIQS